MTRTLVSVACLTVLAACGGTGSPSTGGAGASGTTPPIATTTLASGTASLGPVLTDSRGFTVYYFLPEKGGTLGACDAGCLGVWPPVVATGMPTAASGITGSLGTVSLSDGTVEVTYNGWPLHTYAGGAGPAADSAPGTANGNGISQKWYAAAPALTSTSGPYQPGAAQGSGTPGYGY